MMRPEITAPDRFVDQHAGTVLTGEGLHQANDNLEKLAKFQADIDNARAEVSDLADLLKASGAHVKNLTSAVSMYQQMSEDYREQLDEMRYAAERYERAEAECIELRAGLQELRGELTIARGERDTAGTKAIGGGVL